MAPRRRDTPNIDEVRFLLINLFIILHTLILLLSLTDYLVARGYTVDVHNDFSKFIDENTASMTDPDVENGLIASIHAEINDRVKRKDKTDDNADASEELAEVKREKRKADSITQKLEKERQKELDKMRKQAGQ
jgi:hypothetical protein